MTSLIDKVRENTSHTGEERDEIIKDTAKNIIDYLEKVLLDISIRKYEITAMISERDFVSRCHTFEHDYVWNIVCQHFEKEGFSVESIYHPIYSANSWNVKLNWYPTPVSAVKGISAEKMTNNYQ